MKASYLNPRLVTRIAVVTWLITRLIMLMRSRCSRFKPSYLHPRQVARITASVVQEQPPVLAVLRLVAGFTVRVIVRRVVPVCVCIRVRVAPGTVACMEPVSMAAVTLCVCVCVCVKTV